MQVATGAVFRPQAPPERLRDVVEAAEAPDVAELWLWEDCFLHGGLTAATAALAWSERLHVGIGLLPVALRNPAVAALREHTAAVRDLLHGRRVDVDGRYVHLEGVALDRPPVPPPPPLLLGARGPRTLRLAGEVADGVILDAVATPDELRAACAEVDAGRATAGRTDPYQVVVYREPPAGLSADELADVVGRAVRDLGGAGATSVVFVPGPDALDPGPLLRALAG